VIETSLGYFLTPLTSVLLGVVFLHERLRALQRAAVTLALSGVLWLTLRYGHVPWLAMGLCLSFGSYGLVRKVAPAGSLVGYFLETLFISPFATVLILSLLVSNTGSFIQAGARISLL
jgi:chloramphenicol-sensitive protein RarD